MIRRTALLLIPILASALTSHLTASARDILVEAESFARLGGWVVDQQSMPAMGSPYLLAHGLGVAVEDAVTTVDIQREGRYRIWVRTRDWTARWSRQGSPGRFKVAVNGQPLSTLFGTEGDEWHWQDGGTVTLHRGGNELRLHDLTGFDGRCDAIYITSDTLSAPPSSSEAMARLRQRLTPVGRRAKRVGRYDLVVVGGGIAGCCAAVSAARLGCRVALVQDRPVLGGNNSSEVRVGLSGLVAQQPYPNLGKLLDEVGSVGYWNAHEADEEPDSPRSAQIRRILALHPEKMTHNAGPASNYGDGKKRRLIESHPEIDLYLSTHITDVERRGSRITAVTGQNILTGERLRFEGKLFADCTGDATVGFLAGADFRSGRESRAQSGEPSAPDKADSLVMGTSVQWYSEQTDSVCTFPECPWALQFDERTAIPITRGDWDWETGLDKDQIYDIEHIRDYALLAVYGNWAYLKNHSPQREEFARRRLAWVAYIGGKRESRRLLGDVVLREQDLIEGTRYDDAAVTATWGIDLHYPHRKDGFDGEPFLAYSDSRQIAPYPIPYRCLYSRNIDNLFMAGRDISVTHIALGSVRVMRTGGMMGEVVGMAASICRRHNASPRDVYRLYLPELKRLMSAGTGKAGFPEADTGTSAEAK